MILFELNFDNLCCLIFFLDRSENDEDIVHLDANKGMLITTYYILVVIGMVCVNYANIFMDLCTNRLGEGSGSCGFCLASLGCFTIFLWLF